MNYADITLGISCILLTVDITCGDSMALCHVDVRTVPSSKKLGGGGQILKISNSAAYIQATAMYFRG